MHFSNGRIRNKRHAASDRLICLRISFTIIVMNNDSDKSLQREILLSFWKVHILHHAEEGEVVGNWMLQELRRHGYDVSPGTLYPILHRMENIGWLTSEVDPSAGPRAKRAYWLTALGKETLEKVRVQLRELIGEAGAERDKSKRERKRK